MLERAFAEFISTLIVAAARADSIGCTTLGVRALSEADEMVPAKRTRIRLRRCGMLRLLPAMGLLLS